MWPNPQFPADLVTFTEEILNGKPSFLCNEMLCMKVWLRIINLVGEVMLERRLVEYMMSRKSETSLFESYFRRSVLKLPRNITSLFSPTNFSERGFRYSSLNSLCCVHGCLYIHPTTIFFGVHFEYFQKN